MSKRLRYTALVILAACLLVPTGLAAQDVVYTGCIRSADGSLYNVRQGTSPVAPCRAKDNQINWNMFGPQGPQGPPGPPTPSLLEVSVNCDEGQSINEALAATSMELVVEVQGVCAEYVRITRDNVTLRGVGGGATIDGAGFPEPKEPGILVSGATNVAIENLVVQHTGWGIDVHLGSSVTLKNVVVQDSWRQGLRVYGSAVEITDLTVQRSYHGIWIGEGGHAVVNGGTVLTKENDGSGLVISGGTLEFSLAGGTIESRDNKLRGITFQVGAAAQLGVSAGTLLVTTGNGHAGVAMYGGVVSIQQLESTGNRYGIYVDGPSSVGITGTIADNRDYGVWCTDGGLVSLASTTVTNDRVGIRADGDCRATLSGVTVQGNSNRGMWLDGATAAIANTTISGNTGTDVVLGFGSRVSFDGGNKVGTVSCDGTQLIRGDVSCPIVTMAAAAAQGAGAEPATVMPEMLEMPAP